MSIDALQNRIRKLKNPSMLGLDPAPELIPSFLMEESLAQHGKSLLAVAECYREFCTALLEELSDLVPAVKFQSACFEALGFEGVKVMQELMVRAKELGYYVLLDSMRGDVNHIAAIRAEAIFGGLEIGGERFQPYCCDGITVCGYLGSDGILPFLPYLQEGKNLFLVVKSSNKSSREVQDLISGDRIVHTAMADLAMRWNQNQYGKCGYSELVAVVGGTKAQTLKSLRQRYDRLFFLVPGYGAQGGTPKTVQYAFDRFGHGAIVTASRSILGAWKKVEGNDGRDFREAARRSAEKMRDDIGKLVTVL